jgi:Ca2+-binding RTX toxin-like protein
MEGGAGDDTYIVDHNDDVVVEADGAGVDTVRSSVNYMLPDYVNNLTLTGTAIHGFGNAAANTMVGNNIANQLWGEGGNDRIFGQAGDDLINGYDGNDTIDGGAGNDEISGDILDEDGAPLTGMDDTLYGRDGDDSVYGSVGQDRLFGGTGNDRLNGGGGNDQVFGEHGNDDLGGSAGDDLLSGGAGNDRLSAGMGFDTLTGGSGADGFFSWRWDSAGDRITDFQSAMDELSLLSPDVQPNTSSAFVSNDPRFYAASGATRGHDATDRVVYDTSTGNLYYDPDGSGSARSQLVFMLDGAPTVVATDITLFN